MVGKDGDKYLGNAYTYIEDYASKARVSAFSACFHVIADVEKILQNILTSEGGMMGKKSNRGFMKNHPLAYAREFWSDSAKYEFNLKRRVEDLIEYASVFDFIGGKALARYPEKKGKFRGL